MANAHATPGAELPAGYIFDESGIPDEIRYLGNLSISAAGDQPFVIAGDLGHQEFGRVPLSAITTTINFVPSSKVQTSTPATASALPGLNQISFGWNDSASTLTVFVKTTGGTSLSGTLNVDNGVGQIFGKVL